jgi:hypothetical protein
MDCESLIDDRLDVLYGEADRAARARVEEHLAQCGACREEMAGLKRVRHDLKAWTLPEGRGPAFVAPRPARAWLPVAAGLVVAFGAGLVLSGTELRYDRDGFTVRVGRADSVLRKALGEQEARALQREAEYRREMNALKASLPATSSTELATTPDAVLHRVAEMLRDAEAKQESRYQKTLARLDQKQDAQRRYDMARIAASLSYLDSKNGQHVARTNEVMGYVLEAAQHETPLAR